MTTLPRAATVTELGYIRADNQSTRLYLTAHQPATVYTAVLSAVPTSTDQVTSITYTSGSGTLANVLQDMTLLVGSTPGGFEYGQCRIRKAGTTTAGTLYIGESSEVNWQSSAYLTVLDEFVPWAKHLRTSGGSVYMDYDIAYTDQHSHCDSVPVLGPHAVAWLHGASVTVSFDASQSWALNNTITGYAWTFTGAASSTGTTTSTATATYNAAGTYRVACAITNSDGTTFTGYRYVFVVTASTVIDQFTLGSVRGDYSGGGWSFDVTLYDQADRVTVRDRALIILHAVDYYGNTQASIGCVAGRENIVALGWVAGDSINWQPQDKAGNVSFSVTGLNYWLEKMSAFPVGLKDTTSAPTKWTKFQGLTPKAVTWHMLHWRTTLTRFADVFAVDSTSRAARIEAPGAQTLWQQLNTMLDTTVIAKACCDRFSRLFNQIEQQVLSASEKSSIPSVITITGYDWTGQIDIERQPTPQCSLADFSGVAFDGTNATPYLSLSPGHVFKQFGTPETRERLILDTQTIANQRAGAFVGWKNNPYPRLNFDLPSNNRLIDIAPHQWLTTNIATSDTVREITATSLHIIPRTIEYTHVNGYLTVRIEAEAESTADISVTNVRPPIVINPIVTPPAMPPVPTPTPTPTADGAEVWLWHHNPATTPSNAIIYSTDYFSNPTTPTWQTVAALPGDLSYIQGGSITNDGSVCYIAGVDTLTHTVIWKSINPKAVTPTWTKIVSYGDATGIPGGTGTIENVTFYAEASNGFAALVDHSVLGSHGLICNGNEAQGVKYDRGQTRINPDGSTTTPSGLWNSYSYITAPSRVLINANSTPSAYGVTNYPSGDGYAGLPDSHNTWQAVSGLYWPLWRNAIGGVGNGLAVNQTIPGSTGGSPWKSIYQFNYTTPIGFMGGSPFGAAIYILAYTSTPLQCQLHYALNGRDFNLSSTQTWTTGRIIPANLSGGKHVLWVLAQPWYRRLPSGLTVTNSNEFMRYSLDITDITNNPWTSSTGNMWTTIIASGDLTLWSAGVVYA